MHRTRDLGTTNLTEGTPAANKLSVPEHTVKSNAGIQYSRLIHRRCASLDLETVFKHIRISQNIEKDVCKECKADFCKCPAFTPGTPCSSVSSTPINTSDELIPELVPNKPVQQLHLPVQIPSDDEEADREVAAICKAPEYYRVRSHLRRRRHYFMYNALDDIGEETYYKRRKKQLSTCAGTPC